MEPILSVALTITQGASTPTATATLGYTEDHMRSHVHLRWDLPTRINADGQVGEWLYAALSRVVQDFDDHVIEKVSYETDGTLQEHANG